jgi:hypothetical protein
MCKYMSFGMCSASMIYKMLKEPLSELYVHSVQPGMVTTDLLMSGATTKQVRDQARLILFLIKRIHAY